MCFFSAWKREPKWTIKSPKYPIKELQIHYGIIGKEQNTFSIHPHIQEEQWGVITSNLSK
jgi:hypothetical protein